MVRYGMEHSSPKRKDYAEELPRSKNAVKAATPAPFKPYVVPQPYHDQMAKCAAYRAMGTSWKPEGAK